MHIQINQFEKRCYSRYELHNFMQFFAAYDWLLFFSSVRYFKTCGISLLWSEKYEKKYCTYNKTRLIFIVKWKTAFVYIIICTYIRLDAVSRNKFRSSIYYATDDFLPVLKYYGCQYADLIRSIH